MGYNRISECEDLELYNIDIIFDKRRVIGSIVTRGVVLTEVDCF